jgi:short-subunit dehydrogenase involved in D-alanine esterification of teichoic acids
VSDEASVVNLYQEAVRRFGRADAILNNATIAVLGTVKDLPIEKWDASYRVNLRRPVLPARAFLPDMISRRHGTFVCVSSTGSTYLGGYETFKAAQVHLANTLDAELEGTGVIAFTIGPRLVPTETANVAVSRLAPLMGMTTEEFYALNKNAALTPEEAGAGFAAAILFAERFKGLEISSLQALKAADINFGMGEMGGSATGVNADRRKEAAALCEQVRFTPKEQSDDWKQCSLKTAGMSLEEWLDALVRLKSSLQGNDEIVQPPLDKLAGYYNHLAELAKGYEKNAAKLEENLRHVYGWRDEVEQLVKLLV